MSDQKRKMTIIPMADGSGYNAWFDGLIRITDPSYSLPDFSGTVPLDDLTVTFEEPGLWAVTATTMDRTPDPRTGSLVMTRVAANPKVEDTETIEIGKAAVDTGHIAIVAEKFGGVEDWEDYVDQLHDDLVGPQPGTVAAIDGTLVCRSGLGDGNYSVYGTRLRDSGELVKVVVDFTPSQAAWEILYGGIEF